MELAAVYNPARDEMFTAQKGRGAWLNGKKLVVSTSNELAQSVIVTGFPYDRFTNPNNNLNYFNAFVVRVRGIRRLGAAALDLCYVAAGRLDGYWEIRLEAWDMAAGLLIAQEAGAKVTDMLGIEIDLSTPPYSVIAANPGLHVKMADLIRETNLG